MAMVTVCDGQRVICRGRVYGPGDQFDAGDFAFSLVDRGLVVLAGVVEVEATPVPPDTIAAADDDPLETAIEVPTRRERRGKGYKKTGDDA